MTSIAGIDLNGANDQSIVRQDGSERIVRGGVPSVAAIEKLTGEESPRIIVGPEASQAIAGRGCDWPEEAHADLRIPILEVLDRIKDRNKAFHTPVGEIEPLSILSQQFSYLAAQSDEVVLAIPDLELYDERVRQRLLDASREAGLGTTLIWRPIAVLLAWAETLNAETVLELEGKTVATISVMPDGVHLSSLKLEVKLGFDGPYVVPVRRNYGRLLAEEFSVRRLAEVTAKRFAGEDSALYWQALWGTELAWCAALGKKRSRAREALQRADGSWMVVDQRLSCDFGAIQLKQEEIDVARKALDAADFVLFEGSSLSPNLPIARQVFSSLALSPNDDKVAQLAPDSTRRGCIVVADRTLHGLTTYYDFLPQLEINALSGGEHVFQELITADARAEGGKPFRGTIEDKFQVEMGTKEISFYLIKQGVKHPRLSVEVIPSPPTKDVKVGITVVQYPAQGYAKIEVVPALEGALGRRGVVLNWDRMEPVEKSREEILDELGMSGFAIPDAAPQLSHPRLWTAGKVGNPLTWKLEQFINAPSLNENSSLNYLVAAQEVARHMAGRKSPYKLTGRKSPDRTLYTAVSSEGKLPVGTEAWPMPPDAAFFLELAHKRALQDLERMEKQEIRLIATDNRRISGVLLRMLSWCFLACPDAIVDRYRGMVAAEKIDHPMLSVRAIGRTFSSPEDIRSFFGLLEAEYRNGRLKLYQRYALKEILLYRERAAEFLTPRQATFFAQDVSMQIAEANRTDTYEMLFSNALAVVGALLRYRVVDPSFLTPGTSSEAQLTRAELDTAIQKLKSPAQDWRKRRRRQRLKELAQEIRNFLDQRGSDKGVLVAIMNEDESGHEEPERRD